MASGAPQARREEALAAQRKMVQELEAQDEDVTIDVTLLNAIMVGRRGGRQRQTVRRQWAGH